MGELNDLKNKVLMHLKARNLEYPEGDQYQDALLYVLDQIVSLQNAYMKDFFKETYENREIL